MPEWFAGQHVGEAHTNASPAVGRFLSFSPGRTAASQRPQEGLEGSKSPPVASPSLPKAGVTKEASKSAPQADSPSKSPQTLSLGAVSDITNKVRPSLESFDCRSDASHIQPQTVKAPFCMGPPKSP